MTGIQVLTNGAPCLNKQHQPKILERQLPIWELLKDKQVLHKLDGRSRKMRAFNNDVLGKK
jgi:hypothetical protein